MDDPPLKDFEQSTINTELVAELYVKYSEELRSFLTGVLRNADLAAEALQATFARALEAIHTSQEETRRGWIFRVAFHEAVEIRRKSQRQNELLRKAAWAAPAGHNSEQHHPAEGLVHFETVNKVKEALQEIPPEQQEVVRKRIYEEKTFAEIAAELNQPLGTILTRMRLALKKLSQHLKSEHD